MGFYGNITNTSKTSFQFDRIYSNRVEMEKNNLIDGIFIGRHVLIEYDQNGLDSMKQVQFKNGLAYYGSPNFNTLLTQSNTSDKEVVYTIEDEIYVFYMYTGKAVPASGELKAAEFTKITSHDKNTPSYVMNYHIDIAAYGAGRGYDSTVWQKTYTNDVEKYVMIAELNTVVPTFDVAADAPTMNPIVPHFDTQSTDVYYKLHWQAPWGFRVAAANGKSDEKTQWTTVSYDPDTGKQTTSTQEKNAAIYFNKAGFNPSVKNKDTSTSNEIKLVPTGKSGNKYNKHDGTSDVEEKEDIQELTINLPAIGNMMSDAWDIIYGPNRDNSATESLQGRLNLFKALKGNQIPISINDNGYLEGYTLSNLKLVDYTKGSDNNDINDNDKLGEALSKLQTQIHDEETTRAAAITREEQARAEAVQLLTNQINTEEENRKAAISAEEDARAKADADLSSRIDNEEASRKEKDTSLDAQIVEINNNLANEAIKREEEDTKLLGLINTESENRLSEDTKLTNQISETNSNLATETNERIAADNAEKQARENLSNRVTNEVGALSNAINEEINARKAAIQEEANLRAAAIEGEAKLRSDAIAGEEEARKVAISNEASLRAAADSAEAQARETAISAERQARETQISTETQAREAAIEAEIKARQSAISALEAVDSNLSTLINNETSRAISIEQSLQDQINLIINNPDTENVINSITEFTQYINEHGTVANGFRTDIDKNKEDIQALSNDLETVKTEVNTATSGLKNVNQEIITVNSRCNVLDKEVKNLINNTSVIAGYGDIVTHNANEFALSSAIAEKDQEIYTLNSRCNVLDKEVKNLINIVADLTARIEKLENPDE